MNFGALDSILLTPRYYSILFDMQKIQKFQFGRNYAAAKSTKKYELIDRNGHYLLFRIRDSRTKDSWKQTVISTYKADASGAFEEVLFSDGTRLRSTSPGPEPKKACLKEALAT